MKQEMTSADVAALVSELGDGEGSLIDSKIGKIYQPVPGEIRVSLFIYGVGRDNLVIQAGKRAHLSKYIRESPQSPHAFPMLLRKHIMGGRVTSFKQYDFDRIIEIGVIRGGIETILVCELFSRGNIVLLDSERKIILPMNPVTFRGRRVRSGEIYEYPEAQLSPLEVNIDVMSGLFASSTADVVRTIATSYNLGGVLAEEVCLRAGVDKKLSAKDASFDDLTALSKAIVDVFTPIIEHNLKPCIVKKSVKGELQAVDVLPLELTQYSDSEKEHYPSFNRALDEFFGKKSSEEVVEQVVAKKKEKEDVFERRLRKQQEAILKFEKDSDKYTLIAESIYGNYQTVEDVLSVLEAARSKGYSWKEIWDTLKKAKDTVPAAKSIVSIDSAEGNVVVDLNGVNANINIRKTIPQNAQTFYEKAKKGTKKREGALIAIEDTKKAMQKREKKVSSRRKAFFKKHWYDRFRWFFSSDGFLVIGGRDADTNEEIVKKYMEKRDIVFHTQVPGAPITVIKTEGKDIPETTLEEAARFVVSYSSVWKSGQFNGDCYWIKPEQVSKTPESGEYVKKGSFIIRGERNYFKDVPVDVAIGLDLGAETRVIGGPLSAIKSKGKYVIEVMPGKFNQNDISKKLYRMYVDELKDPSFVKQIASPDRIAKMLPPGESDIKN